MNTKKRSLHTSLLILSVIALFPISAFAHVVVGATTGFGAGFSHPFSGFDHLLAMIAVGLWAAQLRGRAIWAVPGAFVTLMVFGGILAVSGTRLPYVEAGILASIMVLGIMIAAAFRFPVLVNVFIVGIFAVFHGHAHGTEMPLAMGAVSYGLGFTLATVLLHAAGIAAGMMLQKLSTEKIVRFAGAAIAVSGVYLAFS